MDFLEELKLLMNRKNVTQKYLAEKLGVTEGTVSRWLNGKRKITLDTFLDILEALGVTSIKIS